MFIAISIIFVLSIFCLTILYEEHVEDEAERQASIASIKKLRAINAASDTFSTTPTKSSKLWLTRSRGKN